MLSTVLITLLLPVSPVTSGYSYVPQNQDTEGTTQSSLTGTAPEAEITSEAEPLVETLFVHGGRIYLGNADGGAVEALLIENGRVVAAGTEKRLRTRLPEVGVNLIDLKGAVAVPGIQDAHARVERLGASLEELDLRGVASYEELVERVAAEAKDTPKGQWILGHSWDHRLWEGAEFPTHAALSAVTPDNPVLLWRVDGFTSLVNRKALELAGLHETLDPVPAVQGGRVVVDDELNATGLLLDTASDLVTRLFPTVDAATIEARLLAAQEQLLSRGITCVHDMGTAPEALAVYKSLRERDLLKLRVVAYVDGNGGLSDELAASLPWRPDDLDLFSVPGVAFQLDGDLGTRCAAMLEPYTDSPKESGHLWLTEKRLTLLVHEAWQAGLQPAIHAVGDRANRIALDSYERMIQVDENFANLRPRVEQAQVISARDIPRFPALKVVPSMQPTQTLANFAWLQERLGANRSRGQYAWQSLAPGLMQLAFGSGLPFEQDGPLQGIYAARMRRDHESLYSDGAIGSERLTGLGALAGFTRGPAHAAHQEDRRGELIPGFWADLTVFDQDPIDGDPEALVDAKVLLTVINGRVAYQHGAPKEQAAAQDVTQTE